MTLFISKHADKQLDMSVPVNKSNEKIPPKV